MSIQKVSYNPFSQARRALECFLASENRNYYNPLGVNLKLHRQYRHTWIAIEINHLAQGGVPLPPQPVQYVVSEYIENQYPIKGASTSETSPLVYAIPQQPVPPPQYAYAQPLPQQNPYPYAQNY